jgi:ATP-dependent Lon protease
MEVVTLSGYTQNEKAEIARRHLVPRVLEEHGLTAKELVLDDEAVRLVIERYTREAGVRELQRRLAQLCRQRALEVARGAPADATEDGEGASKATKGRKRAKTKNGQAGRAPARVTAADVERLLGLPPFDAPDRVSEAQVGVANGLAWTPAGGEILSIEATLLPGKGQTKITGMLGEVMRESFDAAFSWVRAAADELGIEPEAFARHDVHLHVPAGATPKDGPSAGVTIATCLASLFTGKPVRADLAMTGEITLKGRVLPVGGIKEKVLAAHRAGVKTVLLPAANRKDLARIPAEVQKELTILFTEDARKNVEAALMPIFLPGPRERRTAALPPEPPAAETRVRSR